MAKIIWQRTVVRDGWHNMNTDLCFWHDCYWLVYSQRAAHVSPDGTTIILRSVDLERWQPVACMNTGRDDRDPKLLATEDRLYVYFFRCDFVDIDDTLRQIGYSYVSSTTDGSNWSKPEQIQKKNYWLWRIRTHNGTFYSPEKGGELLSSTDCVNWTKIARIPTEPDDKLDPLNPHSGSREVNHMPCRFINESDVIFRPDGELWCVSRTAREPDDSILYFSRPPYTKWEWVDLKTRIHCPVLCENKGKVYVAGRRDTAAPWVPQSSPAGNTGVFLLDKEGVSPVVAVPSDGDAAYPGLISRTPGRLLMCYYSQHAYAGGVVKPKRHNLDYLQEWLEKDKNYPFARAVLMSGPNDIFIAEIDLDTEDTPGKL